MTAKLASALDLANGLIGGTLTCADVARELDHSPDAFEEHATLVHVLHHYLADEDIRARDDAYAHWQDGELRKLMGDAVEGRAA
ncbi:MAG: hypothetical protein M3N82_07945 [Pseudomonadota bacterium]|nr:hypothetical protein [Pseudomonadota bacterium]